MSSSIVSLHWRPFYDWRQWACACVFAMFVLPKTLWDLTRYRPEDFTGAVALLVLGAAVAAGSRMPDRRLATIIAIYFAYFLGVLTFRDIAEAHHIQAVIFWAKEASYVALGYIVWRAYRALPDQAFDDLTLMMIPNIVFGLYQAVDGELRGIYGVSPFGHERSPASSGMLYLGFAIIAAFACFRAPSPRRWILWILCVALTLLAGSKITAVGLISWTGFYVLQVAWERRDPRSIWIVGGFAVTAAVAVALATAAERLGGTWVIMGRYHGLLQPFQALAQRGVWGKIEWIDSPLAWVIGAGYSPPHVARGAPFSIGMAMDNQELYYLITGGVVGLLLSVLLLVTVYRALPARTCEGKAVRALVVAYACMGLGAEVLQLSVHGNVFWLVVGLSFASAYPASLPSEQHLSSPGTTAQPPVPAT